MKHRNKALDALRVFAIFQIISNHCGRYRGHIYSVEGLGIFFALSGFLTIILFNETIKDNSFNVKSFFNYYFDKFCKILVPYYFVIFIVFFLKIWDATTLLNNIVFIRSYEHFWYLRDTIIFYLLVPFVILAMKSINKAIPKNGELVCAFSLFTLSLLLWALMNITTNGIGKIIPFRIYRFFLGMTFGFFYEWLKTIGFKVKKILSLLMSLYVLVYLYFMLMLAYKVDSIIIISSIREFFKDNGLDIYIISVPMSCLCILFLLLTPNNYFTKLLGNKVLSFLGKLSFSVYLVHFFVIVYFRFIYGRNTDVIYTCFISVGLAYIVNEIIAKPFSNLGKNRSLKEFVKYYKTLLF